MRTMKYLGGSAAAGLALALGASVFWPGSAATKAAIPEASIPAGASS